MLGSDLGEDVVKKMAYPWYRDPEVREREGFPWAQNMLLRRWRLMPSENISMVKR